MTTGVIQWFLALHYWYTRTSTMGISRPGTALRAYGCLIDTNTFSSILRSEATGHWLTRIPATYIFDLILGLAMLKAVARLEFGWSTSAKNPREKGWIPRVYLAKATHVERASDRVSGRIPIKIKFAVCSSLIPIPLLHTQCQYSFSYLFSPFSIS